jgi:hypothetical protein
MLTQVLFNFQSQGSEEGGSVSDCLSEDDRQYRRCDGPPGISIRRNWCTAFQGNIKIVLIKCLYVHKIVFCLGEIFLLHRSLQDN